MKMKNVVIAFAAGVMMACSGCEERSGKNLPEAKFDRGGNTFDLEKLSAERFPIPEGGFTGGAKRLKDSDPKCPVALGIDWAKMRKSAKGGAKGLRLRYRYRNLKHASGTGKVWLTVRGLATQKDGSRTVNQLDWRTAIFETGNQWADYYLPDVGLRSSSDYLELILDNDDGFGELEIKDCSSVPFSSDDALDPKKYAVAVRLDALNYFGNTFALSPGADQLIKFVWKLNDPKLKLERSKLSLRFETPQGVELLSDLNNVPGELMPPAAWRAWYAPFFHITAAKDAPARPGAGTVTAWYDGKPCSKPLRIEFIVVPPAVAKAVPKRYFNGVNLLSPEANCSTDGNLASYVKMMYDAGMRGINGVGRFSEICEAKVGPLKWDSGGSYYIANGFAVGTHPPTWNKCPEDQRFITLDKDGKLVAHKSASCPRTVYHEMSYFKDYVIPGLKASYANRECYMVNWEPNQFFGKGCFCKGCLAEFAEFASVDPADAAKDWPACVRTGGRFFEKALKFRAWQHGRLVKTLDKTVRQVQGEKSKGFCPELVWTEVSGDLLEDPLSHEVAADEYVGSLEWLNAWGPYVCWRADKPYFREKRRGVAEWVSAKVVKDHVRGKYGERPKLISFPSGMQGVNLMATPEWVELCMDSYFFNGWEGSLVYFFPRGLDMRWWHGFARATTRAGYYEDYVLDGVRCDSATSLETVKEYAADCTQVSAYLRKERNISPLQSATYDLRGGRIVAVVNFWEEGAAFFKLKTKGLAKGKYTILADRETLWTKSGGGYLWTEKELEAGVFAGVGAARTKVFEIRPVEAGDVQKAADKQPVDALYRTYEEMKDSLKEKADRDREEEKGRSNLCPDGLLVI